MMRNLILSFVFSLLALTAALAGPQYIDSTGYAVSGYDVVSYFDLKQTAVGTPQASPAIGKAEFTATYNDAKFAFSTAANLKRFQESPASFAPLYDGHCAFGVAKGGKVPGNPNLWRIVDGKLYLNIKQTVVDQWEADIPGFIKLSQGNWPGIQDKAASKSKIPDFMSTAPTKLGS